MRQKIEDVLEAYFETAFIIADGYDDALIGVEEDSMRLVYSIDKCVSILMDRHGVSYVEGVEMFYMDKDRYDGKMDPIFINDNFV